ncbi:aminotransferase class IV [Streptomyces sp. NBC_00683]|uniref:aminotransferase class IV n=1 Tax=Streptomyces sp. NBC_00683 TaxID=2903670 RepID=UPI002E36357A|nr:aminotransferase class IV [Streptomyces sp. NBC_00683]
MSAKQNGTVWVDGALRAWQSVSVPLMSDAVLRSVAVFEGMRADMAEDGRVRLLSGSAHVERLLHSARVLRIPLRYGVGEILEGAATVARAELDSTGKRVAYVRPMALGAALTEDSGPCSLSIAAFAQEDRAPGTVRMQISSLRRPAPDSLPSQVKAVANYQLTRLARITAQAAGYDDAIFLNHEGRLAEAAGAAVLVERQGRVFTPPDWEGALSSITVDVIERIAAEVNVPFTREPVPLSTLLSADGIALAGTLADLVDATCLDDLAVPAGPGIATLRRHYREAMSGGEFAPLLDFTSFPAAGTRRDGQGLSGRSRG